MTFSFLISTSILRQSNSLPPMEWNLFLRGAGSVDLEAGKEQEEEEEEDEGEACDIDGAGEVEGGVKNRKIMCDHA